MVDARLANGYLTSRAGLYAAPRVLRAGQGFSRARLIETLRRAGYVENAASNVWNGAFALTDDELYLVSPASISPDNQLSRLTTSQERLEIARGITGSTHLLTRAKPIVFLLQNVI